MIIMAVTLGAGVDRLIRTSQIKDMAEAVILDAGASILAEQCADILEETIRAENSCFVTGRYSPGYGDFPVEMQGRLIREIDGPRTIGLTTNESHILIPRKSITAIIGMADHPVKGYMATCNECIIKESCRLRKEGKQCWT
jgi:cobalamin-dependent methionine synthase I